ncbi:DMT family transporter [Pelagicoccus mobilis]|uniref:DMT family transporter n=1 Tax=Pelagicoccus mobilis TaxID=415221 RepID=A0A934RUT9_9BACT|nr:DMT family transporter [Pelagicoccus mobilis]MBK1875534.1 DMT family transporter [Pelagicoccus mobilis]
MEAPPQQSNPRPPYSLPKLALLAFLAMLAFAGNSILCRLALSSESIDPASFTTLRLASGATLLALLVSKKSNHPSNNGSWRSALTLLAYSATFSFAYVDLHAGVGALLQFTFVQATMIGYGLMRGEKLSILQSLGIMAAITGVTLLLLPGLQNTPPLIPSTLMAGAGISWGLYSIFGRSSKKPIQDTAGNFLKTLPIAILISLIYWPDFHLTLYGFTLAVASGAIASGLGYALWYTILPHLKTTTAATLQLSVPAIATLVGATFLLEPLDSRTIIATITILGGIWIYLSRPSKDRA